MNSRLVTIIGRFLKENEFEIDGFKYEFKHVSFDEDLKISVNVITPKKHQSYVIEKFKLDISEIIENLSNYIGETFSYRILEILVNGKKPEKNFYVTPEKQEEILDQCNNTLDGYFLKPLPNPSYRFEIEFSAPNPKRFYHDFYHSEDGYLNFSFIISVNNLMDNNGEIVKPEDLFVNRSNGDFFNYLNDTINDRDSFGDGVQDIIFGALEPELKVVEYDDLYYHTYFNVDKINGVKKR